MAERLFLAMAHPEQRHEEESMEHIQVNIKPVKMKMVKTA